MNISMLPIVTVAVPTLNRTQYLRETLACVLAQDYPKLDILVSDNGSRDDTAEVAQALIQGDPRARFRRNEVTVPSHEHFTQCVQAARGEFFILLCDDDCINPRFVSELVAVAMRHADIQVVIPASMTIDRHGVVLNKFATPEQEVFNGGEFISSWLTGSGPHLFINLVTVLGRTGTIRHFGGYRSMARGQNIDNLLFIQCAIMGRVGFASAAEFSWRVHDSSYGSTSTPRDVAESSHQFIEVLLHDDCTKRAFAVLPARLRKQIMNGVRLMTAREFLTRAEFFDHPFRWQSVRRLFMYHWDAMFCFVVLHRYYRRVRDLLGARSPQLIAED